MIVKENIYFERGLDAKKALGVGRYRPIYNPSFDDIINRPIGTYLLTLRDGRMTYIKTDDPGKSFASGVYFSMNKREAKKIWANRGRTFWIKSDSYIWIADAEKIEAVDDELLENISFERGLGTKAALNVGQRRIIEKWFRDVEQQIGTNIVYTINDDLSVYVNGSLYLSYTIIDKLPDNLTVEGDLHITGTKITKLPDNLTVNGHLILSHSKITKLPDNLTVGRNLYISGIKLTDSPINLKVGGQIIKK